MKNSISEKNKQSSLCDFCVYFEDKKEVDSEISEVDKFVGLKYINKKLEIHFPVGFERPEKYFNLTEKSEIEKQTKNPRYSGGCGCCCALCCLNLSC